MQQTGLVVNKLVKCYKGDIVALAGVDLTAETGLYGLLGPNGAGKSTLMRTLATLQQPDTGSIHLDGIDVLTNPDYLRQRLGYLPQQISAYQGVSAYNLLERFTWLKGYTDKRQRRAEVGRLLEYVNLEQDAHRTVVTYSGGMLRRFGIALAMIGSPRLLVIDEPTAGLDPAERNRFHRVLADVGTEAVVLLSTHIVEDIENLCTHLSIMNAGRIVATGTPDMLKNALAGRIWEAELSREYPIPEKVLHVTATPHGNRVVIAGEKAEGFSAREPKLEDVYHYAISNNVEAT